MYNAFSVEILHQLKIKHSILLDTALITAGSIFVAVTSQFTLYLPFSPIPITGQTLAVLLCGAVLGARRGGLSLMLYLLEGAIGLPVFAGGHGGVTVLFGPTAGYLVGFIPAAVLVGAFSEKGFFKRWHLTLFIFFIGQMIIYLFGALGLMPYIGYKNIFAIGIFPFLIGDAVKAIIAMVLLPSCWKVIKKRTA